MSQFGDFNFQELQDLQNNLQQMKKAIPGFYEGCLKELAGRLLAKAIARTPVGDTGNLRKGWTIGPIQKNGSEYQIEVINPVEYSKYVEFGHRTRNHTGWVEGRFMLTISENELRREMNAIMERKFEQFIKRYLGW
ncbi:HK97 gp10 family phage protein [Paenibacillus vulneris]|uniref:HK97 gp10 family phage protein n=1 Tax=Paenibacillus vulneris TaxID=1133364 RepID=A0ABW3UX88_9BACL